MRLHVFTPGQAELSPSTAIVIPCYEDLDQGLGNSLSEADADALKSILADECFKGKGEESYVLPTPNSAYRCVVLMGLGKHGEFDAEVLRRSGGQVCAAVKSHKVDHVVLDASLGEALPVEAFIEGVILGSYDFIAYKEQPETPVTIVEELSIVVANEDTLAELREGCARTAIVCKNTNWARDLANTPPNDLTPTKLGEYAEGFAKDTGLSCTLLDDDALKQEGLNGILCVSQGSSEEARLIVLEYTHPEAEQTLALVGKGITFDTGGISLKPGAGMHEMKFDMCAAAAVLAAMKSIGELKPKINVIGVVPSAENKTGAEAYVPGDIITMYNGKKVEVHNTDAEGRMLLADALAYTEKKFAPDAMINFATLTGAMVVALGHYAAGIFGNDLKLQEDLQLAAHASGERVWAMPLWDDYCKLMEGTHADLCNIGPAGEAGSITAAAFLKNFVSKTPWVHVDIAGTAWSGKNISYLNSKHATGYGVRLITQWVFDEAAP